ncbi:hypothetical protein F4777DRAFT_553015 [Nemania sp. FL0916]|nr:hypothetical protein F4777DRAFT_553015 [Nemania sp. FL0916]
MNTSHYPDFAPVFATSICPEPSAYSLLICTALSALWIGIRYVGLCDIKPQEAEKSYGEQMQRIILTTLSSIILEIILLEVFWMDTIFVWCLRQLLQPPIDPKVDAFVLNFGGYMPICVYAALWSIKFLVRDMVNLWDY